MNKLIGIYKLTSPSGKVYIGQSIDIYKRFSNHKAAFNIWLKNKKSSNYLYSAFQKYGVDSFIHEIIEECRKEETDIKEQYWLDFYKSYENDKGYNILQFARSTKGKIINENTRKKMSESQKGKKLSEETINKLKLVSKGIKRIEEVKNKISLSKRLKMSYKINQFDKNGLLVKTWDSLREIQEVLGYNVSNIHNCLTNKSKYSHGYKWKKIN